MKMRHIINLLSFPSTQIPLSPHLPSSANILWQSEGTPATGKSNLLEKEAVPLPAISPFSLQSPACRRTGKPEKRYIVKQEKIGGSGERMKRGKEGEKKRIKGKGRGRRRGRRRGREEGNGKGKRDRGRKRNFKVSFVVKMVKPKVENKDLAIYLSTCRSICLSDGLSIWLSVSL